MVIPSTLDDTLAPAGAHVASLFCQHVAPQLPDGRSWNEHREAGRRPHDRNGRPLCAGLQSSVIGRQALTPLDLEQVFGLTGGDIFHGALDARPVVLGASGARLCRLSLPAARASTTADRAPTPAAA